MRRAFFIGCGIGVIVFLQALLILRLPVRVHALQNWALMWSGVFGLTTGSLFLTRAQAVADLLFAGFGLPLFYGGAAVVLRAGYRRWQAIGAAVALVLIIALHITLYLVVVRSVVA
jgi:hypothetical protein